MASMPVCPSSAWASCAIPPFVPSRRMVSVPGARSLIKSCQPATDVSTTMMSRRAPESAPVAAGISVPPCSPVSLPLSDAPSWDCCASASACASLAASAAVAAPAASNINRGSSTIGETEEKVSVDGFCFARPVVTFPVVTFMAEPPLIRSQAQIRAVLSPQHIYQNIVSSLDQLQAIVVLLYLQPLSKDAGPIKF